MYLTGRLLNGGPVDIGYRYVCSFAGEEPADRAAVADRGVLDVVALLASADNQDLAPRQALAADRGTASSGVSG
jgi:hypothetical protein